MNNTTNYEVIIIGGSYAGLSAAMALGRSLRKVLIVDSGIPCNRQTPHSHNFITHDGEKPAAIAARAKEQVLRYDTVSFLNDVAVAAEKKQGGFMVITQSGKKFQAEKLVLATGIKDQVPDIKGFADCWGISVIHCPYCHGYEFRNKRTCILANGEIAFHIASLVYNLTTDITILTSGKSALPQDQLQRLHKRNIPVIESRLTEIVHQRGQVKSVVLTGGNKMEFDAVYAAIPFIQHSDIPVQLGCELTEAGHIKVDAFQQTTVNGIYACGDNSSLMRSVANAVSAGNMAGAAVNKALAEEQF